MDGICGQRSIKQLVIMTLSVCVCVCVSVCACVCVCVHVCLHVSVYVCCDQRELYGVFNGRDYIYIVQVVRHSINVLNVSTCT